MKCRSTKPVKQIKKTWESHTFSFMPNLKSPRGFLWPVCFLPSVVSQDKMGSEWSSDWIYLSEVEDLESLLARLLAVSITRRHFTPGMFPHLLRCRRSHNNDKSASFGPSFYLCMLGRQLLWAGQSWLFSTSTRGEFTWQKIDSVMGKSNGGTPYYFYYFCSERASE